MAPPAAKVGSFRRSGVVLVFGLGRFRRLIRVVFVLVIPGFSFLVAAIVGFRLLLAGFLLPFGLYRYRRDDAVLVRDDAADRVRELLREHGGRTKQGAIADACDWSASRTQRVLSRMDEEETVEKLRIGRENAVGLSEEE